MSNLLPYRFQTKIKKGSLNAALVDFLKNRDGELTEKERVWRALSAFWLPLAMQESGNYSQKEITRHALAAMQRLQEQITCLALTLDLELPASFVHTFLTSNCGGSLGSTEDKTALLGEGEVGDYLEESETVDFGSNSNSHFEIESEVQVNRTNSRLASASNNSDELDSIFGY